MPTVLYRKNGGEVLKYSPRNQSFAEVDTEFFGVLTDPTTPDGTDIRERVGKQFGKYRQLGFAKRALPDENRIQNATQEEIDEWDNKEGEDDQAQDAKQAKVQLDNHPLLGRLIRALSRRLITHHVETNARVNQVITQWESFKADVLTAGSLTALKQDVRAMTDIRSDLPQTIELTTLMDGIRASVENDDVPRRRTRGSARGGSPNEGAATRGRGG